MCNSVFRPYVPKANMFTLWEGSPSRRNKLDFCEQKILYYYLFAALYMIVNKYVKQIALCTYLSREQKIFMFFLLWKNTKKCMQILCTKNAHILDLCKVFCLFNLWCYAFCFIIEITKTPKVLLVTSLPLMMKPCLMDSRHEETKILAHAKLKSTPNPIT